MPSRIEKTIKNAQVNIIVLIATTILAFFSRRYFLQNLGDQFIGLSGVLGNFLNLLNITELGIGTAVSVTLYKPLFDADREKINDIVSVFGFLYSRVGTFIAIVAVCISASFPFYFKEEGLPLYLPFLMFYAMLYASLLSYFVNFRQIVLSASQLEYVVTWRYNIAIITKVLLQIATSFLPYNYLWFIALEAITITIYSFVLNRTIRSYFPWLDASVARGKAKFKEYKELWTKTKQVFVLKVSHIVFNSSTDILISAFANLSTVALYGNYNMLMAKTVSFIDGAFGGMGASVGNLIAEGNLKKTMKVFNELLCLRYLLAGLCSLILFFVASPVISIWVGDKYIMGTTLVVMISLHFFFQQARITVDNFKNGYGIYQDVGAPIIEVVIFLGLGSLLGYFYGLTGILAGMLTSEFCIKMIWKPYYLFKKGFQMSVLRYYWPLIFRYFCLLAATFGILWQVRVIFLNYFDLVAWYNILLFCGIIALITSICLFGLFYIFDKDFRSLLARLKSFRNKP